MKLYVNEAIHEKTGRIHGAHELSSLSYTTDGRWLCMDEHCGVEMIPCAWRIKNPPHKVAPYFRQKRHHEICCSVSGLVKLSATSRKERVQTEQGFPLPYPSKVRFMEKRQLSEASCPENNNQPTEHVAPLPKHSMGGSSRPEHHRTVLSIRAVCEFYVNTPYDLDLPLEVPGCRGTTFEQVFHRLGSAIKPDPDTRYILYDQVMFTKRWIQRGEVLTLTLLSSITLPDGSKRHRRLHLNLSGWSKPYRRHIIQQLEEALEDARKAHTALRAGKRQSYLRPWLFFIGTQPAPDATEYWGGPYPTIAIFVCEMPYKLDAGLRTPTQHEPFHGRDTEQSQKDHLSTELRDQPSPLVPTVSSEGGKDAQPSAVRKVGSAPTCAAAVHQPEGPPKGGGHEEANGAPLDNAAADLWPKKTAVGHPEALTDRPVSSGKSSPLERLVAWMRKWL